MTGRGVCGATNARGRLTRGLLLSTSLTAAATVATASLAQQAGPSDQQVIVVTAQKRAENIEDVPISMIALGDEKLKQLNVSEFQDYAKLLPSVTFQALSPGLENIYMRGVVSGGDGNHSASLPSVGVYLDEQPITTIQGFPPIHIYDIERVEALAGPQGTLYGASSQSGTLRIITNKPDPSGFAAGYDLDVNSVDHGAVGYGAEGFLNEPLGDRAAIRLVGYYLDDAGYIDNVLGTRHYPTSGVTETNASLAKPNFNDNITYGGRVALKVDLNDSWTLTPQFLMQSQHTNGVFFFDPKVGDLKVNRFRDDYSDDTFGQAALTLEGKIGNFDLTYATAAMSRMIKSQYDYTDYSYYYDTLFGYGSYWVNNDGVPIDPTQYYVGEDGFWKYSNELRITSPQDWKVRFVAGLFTNYQVHRIQQDYKINGLADAISVPGWASTIWLTEQKRIDRDWAGFGELSYDLTDKLTLTGGVRVYAYRNSLKGFFGYNANYSSSEGTAICFEAATVRDAPCNDLDKSVNDWGETHKINLTYHLTKDKMVYFTYATGFRPGGVNRRPGLDPYLADELTSYEVGAKLEFLDHRLIVNGAIFDEDWNDFQFPILAQNGLTEIHNANQANIYGFEGDASFIPMHGLTLNAALAVTHAALTANYCGWPDPSGQPATNCPQAVDDPSTPWDETAPPKAAVGARLPVVPDVKATLTARYEFPIARSLMAHLQGSVTGQTDSASSLQSADEKKLGTQAGFVTADFSFGFQSDAWDLTAYVDNAFDKREDLYDHVACAIATCGDRPYIGTNRPRTIGLKFGQKF
jgi:outer membrane receptor protein involved in Fe transport